MTRPGFTIALLSFAPFLSAATLDSVLAHMDQTSVTFKSMSANIHRVAHIAVINEDDVSEGTVRLKRLKRITQFVAVFTVPDPKSVSLSGSKVEFYYPKLNLVQEYQVDKIRGYEKYLALGFGASGKELTADYSIRSLGEEDVNGDKTLHMELTPKTSEVLQQFPKIELWISEDKAYPLQEKFHQTGGDYQSLAFADVVINPVLPDSAFKLNLPKGVKRETPQK
jgi:outer membrane lipoprotein-sorting protein